MRQYSNEDLDSMFALEVVRAPSPFPPYVPFTDPAEVAKLVDEAWSEVS